ncbi:MAG: hypothetical protein U9O94_01530 [Nanoarchaeota archaeon]|nr:hypothetical protein [Nanoarchaeota archaeon]
MLLSKLLKKIFGRKKLKEFSKDDYIMVYCKGKAVSITPKSNRLRMKVNKNGTATIFIAPKKETIKMRAKRISI